MFSRSLAACLLLTFLTGCAAEPAPDRSPVSDPTPAAAPTSPFASAGAITVTFDRAPPLVVEVASTPPARQTGLMNRTELAPATGMLFVFPAEVTGGFWMKNTLVPLSIAYVNGGRVVSTAEMVPCPAATTDCPTYPAAGPYTHAVEAAAGFFPQYGVRAGTRMQVTGDVPAPR